MAILSYIFFGLLFIWLILYIVGRIVPYGFVYESSIQIEVPPSLLWTIVVGHHREQDWRYNVLEVVKLKQEDGMPVWKEIRRGKEVFMLKTIFSDPSQFILERQIINHKKYGGSYRYEIKEEADGSRLVLKHSAEIYTSHLKLKHMLLPANKRTLVDQYLSDIKQRAIHVREERDGLLA